MIIKSKQKGKFPDYEALNKLKNRIIAAAVVIFFILGLSRDAANPKEYENISEVKYSFHFPDLGQGDCTIIKTESTCIVFDTGPYEERFTCGQYADRITDIIDILVFTHPHDDHIGGFMELLHRVEIRNVMIPDIAETNSQYETYLRLIEERGINLIKAKTGLSYTMRDVTMHVLAPLAEDSDDANNSSMVVKAIVGDVSVLITGDIGRNIEKTLIEAYGEEILDCDILKVPHHGSANSSCDEFLEAVSPKLAVVCCDRYNAYGHPAWQALLRYREAGIPVYTTYKNGPIVLVSDGKNIEFGQ